MQYFFIADIIFFPLPNLHPLEGGKVKLDSNKWKHLKVNIRVMCRLLESPLSWIKKKDEFDCDKEKMIDLL